jgi:ribonuclease BN (tRNA processing enzyme)
MTTELILLGTAGGPTPRGHRKAPANVVLVNGAAYVFDAGNGVAEQLACAGVPFSALRAVFITHNHSDHNADVGTLLLVGWSGISSPVQVYGPPPLADAMDHFLAMQRYDIETRVEDEGRTHLGDLVEVHEVSEDGVAYRDENVTVTAGLVEHPPVSPALGYRIDTLDRSIAFSGDTRACDGMVELARDVDVLVHEVMHVPSLDAIVSTHTGSTILKHLVESHTPTQDVGKVATCAGAKTLVLSHFVPSGDTVSDETWHDEVAATFDGPIVVGQDLMRL